MAELPGSLKRNPTLARWLRIDAADTVTIRTGKVELGQGILTALVIIAAEELELHPSRILVETAVTGPSPNELITAGSKSVEDSGSALRQACAHARGVLLRAAAERLGTTAGQLTIEDGVIGVGGGNRTVDYWTLQGGREFDYEITDLVEEKPHTAYRWVGEGIGRIDLPQKLRGEGVFLQDLAPNGVRHARVVRPPSYHHRLARFDAAALEGDPALVKCIRDGSFLALVATDEAAAARLAARAERAADWRREAHLPTGDIKRYLHEHESAAFPLRDAVPVQEPVPEPNRPAGMQRIEAEYARPYLMHASLAPSAAMALWREERLTVWSHSQGIEVLRACLAKALSLEPAQVSVIHAQGAGAYGHNGADDAALDAALCALALPDEPVLLKWTREQEHQWEPYGPAAHVRMEASLDGEGSIRAWSHEVWSFSHMGRPNPLRDGLDMIAAWHREQPFERAQPSPALAPEAGIHRNAWPIYRVPAPRVIKRFVPDSPLRTSSLRALGAHANVFAIESFMDELAAAADSDPAEFRLRHLDDARAIAVIEQVLEMAGGGPGSVGRGDERLALGRGLGFARYKNMQCYAAVMVETAVDMSSASIQAQRVWIAADAGRVVDPDGLINQLEGGAVQSLSWTLKEAVTFDAEGITSRDWESYPILRFSEVPEVTTTLIDRPERRSLGAGEAAQGPTAAALANAVCAATGLRVRELPITAERLREVAARES